LNISFNQIVKLNSIIIEAPEDEGPKRVKLFVNNLKLDFETLRDAECTQIVDFEKKHLTEGLPMELKFVKFQSVQNITLFFADNQDDKDNTTIKSISFFGRPVQTTNMSNLN